MANIIDMRELVERVFYRQMGCLPPGKDVPAAVAAGYPTREQREDMWRRWCDSGCRRTAECAVDTMLEDLAVSSDEEFIVR